MLVLLLGFGLVSTGSLLRMARRKPATTVDRLTAATAATGFGSVLVGFTALGEPAGLGDVHAAQLVGKGPVAGFPPLFLAAGAIVTITVGLPAALTAASSAVAPPIDRQRPAAAGLGG